MKIKEYQKNPTDVKQIKKKKKKSTRMKIEFDINWITWALKWWKYRRDFTPSYCSFDTHTTPDKMRESERDGKFA